MLKYYKYNVQKFGVGLMLLKDVSYKGLPWFHQNAVKTVIFSNIVTNPKSRNQTFEYP